MSWTEETVGELSRMWGHYSASEIARKIGFTRNAVIGKAHRLGLADKTGKKVKTATTGATSMVAKTVMAKTRVSSGQRVMMRALPKMPMPSSLPPRDNYRPLAALNSASRGEGISVTKAGERQCRWPVGDPRSPDFRFCGCPAHQDLPYCADHARLAYQNVSRRIRATDPVQASQEASL